MAQQISDEQWRELLETRATRPAAVAEAYASRRGPRGSSPNGAPSSSWRPTTPARGSLASGRTRSRWPTARSLLDRLLTALPRTPTWTACSAPRT